jgi:hypothetical protein
MLDTFQPWGVLMKTLFIFRHQWQAEPKRDQADLNCSSLPVGEQLRFDGGLPQLFCSWNCLENS